MSDNNGPLYRTPTLDPDVLEQWSSYVERFENDSDFIAQQVEQGVMVTTLDRLVGMLDGVYNWGRRSSIWPLGFGLACCAIEMIATFAGRYDLDRFGAALVRASPRQADLMIVSGTVTKKMLPQIVRLWNQMPEPRYCIAMGACATGGGPFKEGYNVVSGIDKYIPVDVYVPGCPPTPEALIYGLLKVHEKVERQSITKVPWYRKEASDFIPVPILGPDIFDPRQVQLIREYTLGDAALVSRGAEESQALKPVLLSAEAKERVRAAKAKYVAQKQTA